MLVVHADALTDITDVPIPYSRALQIPYSRTLQIPYSRALQTRDLFKKIGDTKGTFPAKMGSKRTQMVWT